MSFNVTCEPIDPSTLDQKGDLISALTMSDTKSPSGRKGLSGNYILGIDVGTTSVKVCLVNVETKDVSHKFVKDTLAGMAKDVPTADLQVRHS